MSAPVTEFAPAKINLTLRVTGRRADGYHVLDSIVVFADVGDVVHVAPAPPGSDLIAVTYTGPFGAELSAALAGAPSSVEHAAAWMADRVRAQGGAPTPVAITLDKQLPLASGMGGGSADAAATVRALKEIWGLEASRDVLAHDALALGADTPACVLSQPLRMTGIGEHVQRLRPWPSFEAVLINPGTECPTPRMFAAFAASGAAFSDAEPVSGCDRDDALAKISASANDLTKAAIAVTPQILNVLNAARGCSAVRLVRMTGSGATVFALFGDAESANEAARVVVNSNPRWWVERCRLNGV